MEDNAAGERSSNHSAENTQCNSDICRIGIYGWRKRCLYLSLFLLLVLVIINLVLISWVIKVMDFSTNGMGKLKILKRGIRLESKAEFLQTLYTSSIQTNKETSLKLESAQNVTLNARNLAGDITTRLFLGDKSLESMAAEFTVKNAKGKTLFFAGDEKVELFADLIRISGMGGAVFQTSVQTSAIEADYNSDLKIESPTRSLEIEGPQGVALESRSGDIIATCHTDLKLQSTGGAIKLDTERIFIEKLPEASTTPTLKNYKDVFQLCACDNGRLFLAPSNSHCFADVTTCI